MGVRRHDAADVRANHGMFIYDSDDEFVDRVQSFLGPGTDDGELGMAVFSRGKWSLVREALGEASRRILYLDREALYSSPHAALAGYDEVLRRAVAEGVPSMRLMGELPVSYGHGTCEDWTVYEAAINRAFAGRPIWLMCGYDAREQPAAAMEGGWRTHPQVLVDGWEDNPRYQDPAEVAATLTRPPVDLSSLRELPVETGARAFGARLARELANLRVSEARAQNLVLAAREVFENAMTHGAGARSQRIGRAGRLIVWELSDNGRGFEDPLAGYLPPAQGNGHGSGLWKVRQLTHSVEFFRAAHGFTVRLWI